MNALDVARVKRINNLLTEHTLKIHALKPDTSWSQKITLQITICMQDQRSYHQYHHN